MRSTEISTSFNFDAWYCQRQYMHVYTQASRLLGCATPDYLHVHIYTSTVLFFFPLGHNTSGLLVGAGEDGTYVG